jgi:hypothetical protein
MPSHWPVIISFLTVALCSVGAAAAPTITVQVSAASNTRNMSGPNDFQRQTGQVPLDLSATSMVDEQFSGRSGASAGSHGESTARGQSGPGLMRLEAWAYGSTDAFQAPSTGGASSSALAGLRDNFAIVAPGCDLCTLGSRGTMTFSIYFDGGLFGGGEFESDLLPSNGGGGYEFNANWSTTFGLQTAGGPVSSNVGGSAGGTYRGNQNPGSVVSTSTGLGAGRHSFTMDFAFGFPLDLQWQARVAAVVGAGSTGNERHLIASSNALADFSHTFAWAGIQSVLDANGQPVSGFTALNDTGYDYALSFLPGGVVSVPEPGTFALMLAGLFGMAACAQRRRQRH